MSQHTWRSEDSFQELALSSHSVGSGDGSQVVSPVAGAFTLPAISPTISPVPIITWFCEEKSLIFRDTFRSV